MLTASPDSRWCSRYKKKKTYYYDRWKNVKNKPQNIERKNLLINQSIIDTYWCWMYFYFLYKYKYFFSRIHIQVISVSSNPIQSMHMLFIYTIKNGKSSIAFDFVGRHTCMWCSMNRNNKIEECVRKIKNFFAFLSIFMEFFLFFFLYFTLQLDCSSTSVWNQ